MYFTRADAERRTRFCFDNSELLRLIKCCARLNAALQSSASSKSDHPPDCMSARSVPRAAALFAAKIFQTNLITMA